MNTIVQRLLGFDRLIGPVLVKIVYYFGGAIIVLTAGIALVTALLSFAAGNLGAGLMQLLAVPAVAAVALVYWRFLCELFMLAFLAYERLGQIRDLLGGGVTAGAPVATSAPDPNHPEF